MSVQYCACQQGYFCVVYKFSRVTFYFLHVNPKECVGNIRKFVIEISLYIPAYFWGSIEALKCQSCKLLNNRHIHTPPEVVHLCMPLVFIINNLKVLYSYNLRSFLKVSKGHCWHCKKQVTVEKNHSHDLIGLPFLCTNSTVQKIVEILCSHIMNDLL